MENMEKKSFVFPEIEIEKIEEDDIIKTSGFGDSMPGDKQVIVNDTFWG